MKTESVVVLKWIEANQYFLLESDRGLALQDISESVTPMGFFSCLGVLMKFPKRSKEKPQRYKITIEHLGDATDGQGELPGT